MSGYKAYRYKVWLVQAEHDLAAAHLSFENNFFEWTCFQSEQSAEKALKGIMVYCGYKPPKVHKLSILIKVVKQLRPDLNGHFIQTETLQSFTFVSRYPFIVPGDNMTPHDFITGENAKECIKEAEVVLSLAKELTDKKDPNEDII